MAVKKKSNSKKKIVKKATPKPKKQPKASSKKPEFEKAWKEYNSALTGWKESLAQWQKATNEALTTYHDACQKAIGSDAELYSFHALSNSGFFEDILFCFLGLDVVFLIVFFLILDFFLRAIILINHHRS